MKFIAPTFAAATLAAALIAASASAAPKPDPALSAQTLDILKRGIAFPTVAGSAS